ncbi:MAG TPA: PilZ domain-containing protein, partial [Aromatoleum sp.]|uniref:PilZ domain-containing protein n=1 Tax=Aromatoleum sp. TaxID=2307007 RepID=UPI002B470BD8
KRMEKELRSEPREQIALPLSGANGVGGATVNISATGLFFEICSEEQLGSEVDVTVELDVGGRAFALKCHGQVVRVERHANRIGLAIKMQDSQLESAS